MNAIDTAIVTDNTVTKTIYSDGLKGILASRLDSGDVDEAMKMFVTKQSEALDALREYNPDTHKIMSRPNKGRKNKVPYETNKLPLPEQKRITDIAVFFMLGNPLKFYLRNTKEEVDELSPYFEIFMNFLEELYFNERMRDARRIAGSETECAKIFHTYRKGNDIKVKINILANSKNDKLYTLFNRYGDLVSFAHEYYMCNEKMEVIRHIDVYTDEYTYECQLPKGTIWDIRKIANPYGKIPIIYYNQECEWAGVQKRIERLEWLESKGADTTEYFNDPYLKVSADLVSKMLADPEVVGKAVQVQNKDSVFEFVTPPDAGELMINEKKDLKKSINDATFTPDFSGESIKGLGTLSAKAIQKMSLPGYIKREIRASIYNELIRREINLIITILTKLIYVDQSDVVAGLKRLKIGFEYQDPFIGGFDDNSDAIQLLRSCDAMSIRTAVEQNPNVRDKEVEVERIFDEKKRLAEIEASATATTQNTDTNNTVVAEGE